MSRSPSPKALSADPVRRAALAGGLVALPLLIADVRTGSPIGLTPVLYGGFLAGYVYDGPIDRRSRVDDFVGLVGALPAVWEVAPVIPFVVLETTPVWSKLFGVGVALGFVAAVYAIGVVLAQIGVRIGDWASSKAGRTRPTPAGQ